MNARDLAYEALGYIKPSGPTNEATLALASAPQKARIAADLGAALQEIYETAPALYRQQRAALLDAPKTILLTLATGSTDVETDAEFRDGATVNIGGEWNQLHGTTESARLLVPYSGATGEHAATLYCDVVVLPDEISKVLDHVFAGGGRRLAPRANRGEFLQATQRVRDYGRVCAALGQPTVGAPVQYWVEDSLDTATRGTTGDRCIRRLRVMPLPREAVSIRYDAKLRAPEITVADLGSDDTAPVKSLVVAEGDVAGLVRPLFLQRWAGSPWFRDDSARRGIEEDAARARARLMEFHTQQKRNRRVTAPI